MFQFGQFIIVCGHYGCGKTNLSLNLAVNLQKAGRKVTLVDLDLVNPYFRSSDFQEVIYSNQIELIAPVFAHSNLDLPALPVDLHRIFNMPDRTVIIDVGGDDAGATALGSISQSIQQLPYQMLYVVNRNRNLTQEPAEAVEVLREIEAKSHLRATCVVNNTHLQHDTDAQVVEQGLPFAQAVAQAAGLPLACTTVPAAAARQVADRETTHRAPNGDRQTYYPVQVYVRTPWE